MGILLWLALWGLFELVAWAWAGTYELPGRGWPYARLVVACGVVALGAGYAAYGVVSGIGWWAVFPMTIGLCVAVRGLVLRNRAVLDVRRSKVASL
jgi:hypothetical protein